MAKCNCGIPHTVVGTESSDVALRSSLFESIATVCCLDSIFHFGNSANDKKCRPLPSSRRMSRP